MSEIIEVKVNARCEVCGGFIDVDTTGFVRGAAELRIKPCEVCLRRARKEVPVRFEEREPITLDDVPDKSEPEP